MSEKFPQFESAPEHIPTVEEVHSVFKELIGKEYKETLKREDEKGLYLLRVVIPGDTPEKEIEYEYMRKGRHEVGGSSPTTEIHMTKFQDEMPYAGESAARLVDGKWVIL